MSNGLRDTVALVTGASSGIGEATARALAAQGATVAVVARRKDRLDALTAEIGGLAIETDVTDREQAMAAVERTVQELGRLDIVINNAGVMLLGPIVDAPASARSPRARTRPRSNLADWARSAVCASRCRFARIGAAPRRGLASAWSHKTARTVASDGRHFRLGRVDGGVVEFDPVHIGMARDL
jgi:hypothetical protein